MNATMNLPEVEENGLTASQVRACEESGQTNAVKSTTSRSVLDIVRANVFTLFNGIIFAAMVLVLITGSWKDAVFGFVILINTGIGIVTELKAKRTLDRLSILVTSDYAVRRDGENTEVPSRDIVLGDLLWIRSGEQVPADAQVLSSYGLELDESMLTGESRTVRKEDGDQVYSGSTAVSGVALARVNAVGEHSYAATLTAQAKVYKKTVSDLNKGINTILKFMTFLVVPLCVLLVWSQMRTVGGWNAAIASGEWRQAIVSAVAGVVGMIPEGLVLLTSLNFAVAAMRLARKNTLVQELESVETLARVDCLNLDKTGTITDGGIMFDRLVMLERMDGDDRVESAATQALYDLSNEEQPNGTGQAVLDGLGERGYHAGPVRARVPFSSARKWSAIVTPASSRGNEIGADREPPTVWYMGAPEVMLSALSGEHGDVLEAVNDYANSGNRVLLIARATLIRKSDGDAATDSSWFTQSPELLPDAKPVALVLCSERVRDDAQPTLAWFRDQGVRCRIISGDNPVTVGAIAAKVRLTGDREPHAIDARTLPQDINELARVLENVDVIGRVLPDQKKAIVQALHTSDHVVAMTGDGVNDSLAIKEADLGIAMGNAAPATKAVAQVVLVDSKFSHLPDVVARGRSGHGEHGARRQPVPRQDRLLGADFAGRGTHRDPVPVPAPAYHVRRRADHRHAGVHPRARAEHAALYPRLPAACRAFRAAGRRRDRIVRAAVVVAVARRDGLGCERRRRFVRVAHHLRHHRVCAGRVHARPRGAAAQFVARRAGCRIRRRRHRHAHCVRGEVLRPASADRAGIDRHGGGAADFHGPVRGLSRHPCLGDANFPTYQADTPELK